MFIRNVLLIIFLILLSGCGSMDVFLRSERSVFAPKGNGPISISLVKNETISVSCLNYLGEQATESDEKNISCLYRSVDKNKILEWFITDLNQINNNNSQQMKRDIYLSYLLSISEQNCSNFLGRSFASKTTVDATRATLNDILTGSTAAVANSAPPTAAGLALVNLVTNKGADNFNHSFYMEKTFSALRSAILALRRDIKNEIRANSKMNYQSYSISDALTDITRYDEACSIMAGVGKLQKLADESMKVNQELEGEKTRYINLFSQKQELEGANKLLQSEMEKSEQSLAKLVKTSATYEADKKKLEDEITSLKKQIDTNNIQIGVTTKTIDALQFSSQAKTTENSINEIKATQDIKEEAKEKVNKGKNPTPPVDKKVNNPITPP